MIKGLVESVLKEAIKRAVIEVIVDTAQWAASRVRDAAFPEPTLPPEPPAVAVVVQPKEGAKE